MPLNLPFDNVAGPFSGDKILWHADALTQLRDGKVPAPVSVELDLTNHCNLDCPYCTNAQYISSCKASLKAPIAEQVLRALAAMGTRSVTFTGGGEPTLHPQLEALLLLAHRLGLETALITNGLRAVASETVVRTCKWVRFSVDAYNRASYCLSKKTDGFRTVCRTIEKTVAAKKQTGESCTIGVGLLTETIGPGKLAEATTVFKALGVDYVQFRPTTFLQSDSRNAAPPLVWQEDDMRSAKAHETDFFKVYLSAPKYRSITRGDVDRPYKYCTGVYFSCVIGATGDVWICCHMRGNKKFSLGNINQRSFADIWNDTTVRNEVYARIGDFAECMPFCRFHGQNTLLAHINWHPQHINFL